MKKSCNFAGNKYRNNDKWNEITKYKALIKKQAYRKA